MPALTNASPISTDCCRLLRRAQEELLPGAHVRARYARLAAFHFWREAGAESQRPDSRDGALHPAISCRKELCRLGSRSRAADWCSVLWRHAVDGHGPVSRQLKSAKRKKFRTLRSPGRRYWDRQWIKPAKMRYAVTCALCWCVARSNESWPPVCLLSPGFRPLKQRPAT
jgi:hypothetical protein